MPATSIPSNAFKAYDIRGLYPNELDDDAGEAIARAYVRVLSKLAGKPANELRIGLGHDMRENSASMAARAREGMVAEGATVLDAGQVATEMLYFLVGSRELDGGAMVTASHNPRGYTGMKLVREGAIALSGDSGIQDIRQLIEAGLGNAPGGGSVEQIDLYPPFQEHALSLVDRELVKPRRLVVDGNDGMSGPMVGPLLEELGMEVVPMRFSPRADFAEAGPNPLLEENRRMLIEAVRKEGVELGIAWDGDADRCFFIDGTAQFVDGDFLTALLAEVMLRKYPGATILYDVRASRAVADTVEAAGGTALVNRVGHAFFKTRMRDTGAVFGGEVSGHYYFKDFYNADSGTLPALLVLELLSTQSETLAERVAKFRAKYFISGEINSEVADQQAKMDEIAERYSDGEITTLDGISVDYDDWHFNVRPSNTEPLLRLNLESLVSREDMEAKRDEVLALIRS
jgi:phosphomannomutase